jgi:bacillithiol synthase
VRIEHCYLKQNQHICEDYLTNFSRVQGLFDYNPWREDVWEQRVQFLDQQKGPRADRKQLISALYDFNTKVENAPEALTAIRLLEDDRTLVVIGGHQSCLFTGPLLVIYKAITIIQTARQISSRLLRPVIPIFWIAGEDHDFDEVNHIYYLTQDLCVRKIKVDHPTGKRTSISRLTLSLSQWEDVLNQLNQSLIDTEYKCGIMKRLVYFRDNSKTLVEFFARVMSWLFGSQGLVFVDSDDPNIRQIEGPMFEHLINHSSDINHALLNGKRRVESLGYSSQLDVKKYNSNLFVYHQGERTLLQSDEYGGFIGKRGNVRFTKNELIQLAQKNPSQLSNNVVTRTIMQEFLFPVISTILGPGEIAYWGLIRDAFHLFGMKMPIIMPRLQYTIIESSIQKHMQKYNILLEDVVGDFEHKRKAWLEERDALKLKDRFSQVKRNFVDLYTPILELISDMNPGMRDLGKTNMNKILEQMNFLETRAIASYHVQFESTLRQFERIRQNLLPMGKLQERVYNIFAYLNKYGERWLCELIETPVTNNGMHNIIYLK